MRPRFAPIVGLIVTSAFVAGCGSDSSSSPPASSDSPSSGASSSNLPSPAGSSTPPTVTATPTDPVASPKPGPQECAPQVDIKIRIVLGRIDCASSYLVAARVDRDGEKRQNIDGYVCEFGNAMTRPTIFACTNREVGAEFAVDQR